MTLHAFDHTAMIKCQTGRVDVQSTRRRRRLTSGTVGTVKLQACDIL